jgi:hypothetical protein
MPAAAARMAMADGSGTTATRLIEFEEPVPVPPQVVPLLVEVRPVALPRFAQPLAF